MPEALRIALVGCGAVSELYYAPALQALEDAGLLRVEALFDPNPERVVLLRRAFPAARRIDALAALTERDLDLAIIASPPRYHAAQTIQALQGGLSVLCEKPMAASVAEGEAMIEAATATQRVLAVGLVRRFFPATRAIRDLLACNVLGNVASFYCYEGGRFQWPVASASFFKKETAGGGVLLDVGVHLLDLLLWWWGEPVEVRYEDDAMGGVEANSHLTLTFARDFTGEVRLSRDWTRPNRYVIRCTKGWVRWTANEADRIQMGFHGVDYAHHILFYEHGREQDEPGRPGDTFEQSFIRQLRNVIAAVQGTESLVVPGQEGLRSLRLIEQCYRHRTLMPMPWLSNQEVERARQLSPSSS